MKRHTATIVLSGVAGSGKSTIGRLCAGRMGAEFVDADDLHPPANVAKMARGVPLDDADRAPWLAAIGRVLAERRDGGLVLACSALTRAARAQLRASASSRVAMVYLAASPELVRARLASRRDHFMPASLVDSQFAALEPPLADEALQVDASLDPWLSAVQICRATDSNGARPLLAAGSQTTDLDEAGLEEALATVLDRICATAPRRVLLVPPDRTRLASRAGEIACRLRRALLREGVEVEVMPALGTHRPMSEHDCQAMFGDDLASAELLQHRWRDDVVLVGTASAGVYEAPLEINRTLLDGTFDLVVPIGQVVPHEVAGFAGFTKMLCIGLGGSGTIGASHFISAMHGIENTLGVVDTPVRALLDAGFDDLIDARCRVLWLMTVVEGTPTGGVLRGLFAGEGGSDASGGAAFRAATSLAATVNITRVGDPLRRCVVLLDEHEYRSAWLANKAIYRTRMALAEGAELFVVAPGVTCFGEDAAIDRLIRRHGYRGTESTLAAIELDPELRLSPSASAHLIHGSSEGRFTITYSPGSALTRADIEGAGFGYLPLAEARARFRLDEEPASGRTTDSEGEPFMLIRNPGLGLWRRGA